MKDIDPAEHKSVLEIEIEIFETGQTFFRPCYKESAALRYIVWTSRQVNMEPLYSLHGIKTKDRVIGRQTDIYDYITALQIADGKESI